jgi:hypothetical protein
VHGAPTSVSPSARLAGRYVPRWRVTPQSTGAKGLSLRRTRISPSRRLRSPAVMDHIPRQDRNRSRRRDTARRRRNHCAGSPRGRAPRPSRAPRQGRQGCRRWPRHESRARRATAHAARRQRRSRTHLGPRGCNSAGSLTTAGCGSSQSARPSLAAQRLPQDSTAVWDTASPIAVPSDPVASDDPFLPQLCDGRGIQAQPVG